MTNLLIIICTLICCQSYAGLISGEVKSKDFESAAKSDSFLKFTVSSTKIGLLTSDVNGYVKSFKYTFDLSEKNKIVRNMKLAFLTKSMDTDNETRDVKLHNHCLAHKEYPIISVEVRGPIFLNESKEKNYPAKVTIRGKEKKALIKLRPIFKSGELKITGTSLWTLSEMGIPDPSIMIAKLSDEIRIEIDIRKKL